MRYGVIACGDTIFLTVRCIRIGRDTLAQTNLVGYHGTTERSGKAILRQKKFIPSTKEIEWLGHGVYFFKHFGYAQHWAKQETEKKQNIGQNPIVLRALLQCDESEVFDLDDPENLRKINAFMKEYFRKVRGKRFVDIDRDDQRTWLCLSCNMYRRFHSDIAVIIHTFTSGPNNEYYKKGASGFSRAQTQYCVSGDKQDIIKSIEEWKAQS